jgi:hypothetical protein
VLCLTVNDLTPDLGDLKPIKVTQRLSRATNPILNGRINTLSGCANDFSEAIGAIRHVFSQESGSVRCEFHLIVPENASERAIRWD